ncbi:TetR/AcrR family transcriptional regulator [Pseudomonas sp. Irchel s3h17]|uniref:TetR/AcrR family transcriptional regulator n=1 Tax=Pseudomonas sp. Irchel s3h17 TaxID=2009182 RepID=UPI000BA434A0|nr:TetR/AcrR family transcriptional regulator [Pseudomonas sp. Irchel s3h17]
MSSTETGDKDFNLEPRRRLSRENRQRQLLDIAWRLVRNEGTEALTLGRLAELAGVTKPVVYDHFISRSGLLAALYREFDARQSELMDAALQTSEPTLLSAAKVIASSYVDCVMLQGTEIPGVIAALASSPELGMIKRKYEEVFLNKCRMVFLPFAGKGDISSASLRAMLGAAEALSHAATNGEITPKQAMDELLEIIIAMVERSSRHGSPSAI